MFRKLVASWLKFWSSSRTRDDGERGRIIVERLLEMTKHLPVGSSAAEAGDRAERKEA
jgi:hypothetical protein